MLELRVGDHPAPGPALPRQGEGFLGSSPQGDTALSLGHSPRGGRLFSPSLILPSPRAPRAAGAASEEAEGSDPNSQEAPWSERRPR